MRRDQDAAAARGRGTSALPEQLAQLTPAVLAGLAGRLGKSKAPGAGAFGVLVAAEQKRRGGK